MSILKRNAGIFWYILIIALFLCVPLSFYTALQFFSAEELAYVMRYLCVGSFVFFGLVLLVPIILWYAFLAALAIQPITRKPIQYYKLCKEFCLKLKKGK